jgi:hypothetical protein
MATSKKPTVSLPTVTDKKPFKKCTNVMMEKRVSAVFSLLLSGLRAQEIYEYVNQMAAKEEKEKPKELWEWHWEVSQDTIQYYVGKANEMFRDQSKFKREMEFGKALVRLNTLYRRCITSKDLRTALQVQKAINDLVGLNAPVRTAVNVSGDEAYPLSVKTSYEIDPETKEVLKKLFREGKLPIP